MRSIVFGSNGYIGSHLVKHLIELSHAVFSYDIHEKSATTGVEYSQIDLKNYASLEKINWDVDFIFLFSGLTGTAISFSNYDSFIDINEKGLLLILENLKKVKSKAKLVFPSTRLVYKGQKDVALNEDSEKEFKTIYAMNKFSCENILNMYSNCFGLNYVVFRICVPYGNEMDSSYSFGTIGAFLSRANKKEDINIYGDGSQKRSFIHIHDLCQMLILASIKNETNKNIYNVGGPDVYSIAEVANRIAEKYDVKVNHSPWPAIDLALESGDTIFDSSRIENCLSYIYKYTFSSWIKKDITNIK